MKRILNVNKEGRSLTRFETERLCFLLRCKHEHLDIIGGSTVLEGVLTPFSVVNGDTRTTFGSLTRIANNYDVIITIGFSKHLVDGLLDIVEDTLLLHPNYEMKPKSMYEYGKQLSFTGWQRWKKYTLVDL